MDILKLSRNTTILRWNDSLNVHMTEIFWARDAASHYLMCGVAVVLAALTLVLSSPHMSTGGSSEVDQLVRMSHSYPLYADDNAKLYTTL